MEVNPLVGLQERSRLMSMVLKNLTFYVMQNTSLPFDHALANWIKDLIPYLGGTVVFEILPDTIVIGACSDEFTELVLQTLPEHGRVLRSSDFIASLGNIANGTESEFRPTELPCAVRDADEGLQKTTGATGVPSVAGKPKRKRKTAEERNASKMVDNQVLAICFKQGKSNPANLTKAIKSANRDFEVYYRDTKITPSRFKNLMHGWRKLRTPDYVDLLFQELDENLKLEHELTVKDKNVITELVFKTKKTASTSPKMGDSLK